MFENILNNKYQICLFAENNSFKVIFEINNDIVVETHEMSLLIEINNAYLKYTILINSIILYKWNIMFLSSSSL